MPRKSISSEGLCHQTGYPLNPQDSELPAETVVYEYKEGPPEVHRADNLSPK